MDSVHQLWDEEGNTVADEEDICVDYGLWHRREADDWHRARLPLITSLGVGVPWLAIANASAIWATITIFAMAGFAIWALLSAPARDRWWFQAPTGLYAGWLTAASFVSLGSTMASRTRPDSSSMFSVTQPPSCPVGLQR